MTLPLPTHTPVLIVGAGPVGLCCALFLARQGISPLPIERHPTTAIHPRARAFTVRSMEMLRVLGLEEQVREAGQELAKSSDILVVETLAGKELKRTVPPRFDLPASLSPTDLGVCAQDRFEPLLVDALSRSGIVPSFGTELLSFEQSPSGVTATLFQRASRTTHTLQADYLIAADGANSGVRAALALPMQGRSTPLAHYVSAYFRADLSSLVQGREFLICFVQHPTAPGWLVSVNNTDRWVFLFTYDPKRGETPAHFTRERTTAMIRQVIGVENLEVDILSNLSWDANSLVAQHFQAGRVFLMGDAAHIIPPTGGYGMNIGLEDAQNLAWKLALVMRDLAAPSLLDTYEAERRPYAQGVAVQTNLRTTETLEKQTFYEGDISQGWVEDLLIMLGHDYRSQAVLAEGHPDDQPTHQPFLESLDQLGRPGTRAPHVWLQRQGQQISTLDLFGRDFVLLCGTDGTPWQQAASSVSQRLGLPLTSYRIGESGDLLDPEDRWLTVFGLTAQGAVLVRPDGFVAWRAKDLTPSPLQVLEQIIPQLLCLPS